MTQATLAKQILYRSSHRGCKETDFLLGKFFFEKLQSYTNSELELAKAFLEEDDLKIYDWILEKEIIPQAYQTLVSEIRNFHQLIKIL